MLPIQCILKGSKQFVKQSEWSVTVHKGQIGVCVYPKICTGYTFFVAFEHLGYNKEIGLFDVKEFPNEPNIADRYSAEHDWYIGHEIYQAASRYELAVKNSN